MSDKAKFCTVVNCMDGRVQLPVIGYMKKRFNSDYVDSVTEKGPNLVLSEQVAGETAGSILGKVKLSVEVHGSVGIAVAGHYDCAGNPAPESRQAAQIKEAARFLKSRHPNLEVIGLWVDENWKVTEV